MVVTCGGEGCLIGPCNCWIELVIQVAQSCCTESAKFGGRFHRCLGPRGIFPFQYVNLFPKHGIAIVDERVRIEVPHHANRAQISYERRRPFFSEFFTNERDEPLLIAGKRVSSSQGDVSVFFPLLKDCSQYRLNRIDGRGVMFSEVETA